jgi:hypothetical protein
MSVKYQGKKLNPKTYKLTNQELERYKDTNKIRYFYNNNTDELIKYDISTTNLKKASKAELKKGINDSKASILLKGWGLKSLKNKTIIEGKGNIKNITVSKNPPLNKSTKLILEVKYKILYDEIFRFKKLKYDELPTKELIEDHIKNFSNKYLSDFSFLEGWPKDNDDINFIDQNYSDRLENGEVQLSIEYKILSTLDKKNEFEIQANGRMKKKVEYYDIHNLYNNIFELEYYENCVRDYLKVIYKGRLSGNTIDKLGNKNGVTANELYDFCIKYKIKLILYNIEGNIIKANYPTEKRSALKSIIGIYYNSHFVPINNKTLNKVKIPIDTKILNKEEINNNFKKLLEDKIIPSYVNVHAGEQGVKISSYCHDDINYIANEDYDICLKILECYGLKDKITPYTTLSNIHKILESLYENNNIKSFFPVKYNKKAYRYTNPNINIKKVYDYLKAIDKNKCYSYCLMMLEYLIVCDYRTAKIRKGDEIDSITPYYLYVCHPKESNILMQSTGIYAGYHVLYTKNENIEFEILEEIECTYIKNHYSTIIKDLYNKFNEGDDDKIIKDIVNCMIGSFEKTYKMTSKWSISKIADEEEYKYDPDENYYKFDDDIYLKMDCEESFKDLYNKRPIRYQIIDYSNVLIYEKMKELKLNDNKIVCVLTDEITFINNGEFEKLKLGYELDEWKEAKIKEKEFYNFNDNSTLDFNVSFYDVDYDDNDKNYLYDCYAGAGKTTKIIKDIIPEIKRKNQTYIVLTPSHNASKTYKKNKLNCKVIQTFGFSGKIPEEQNIIIDEIGLCDSRDNDVIYKCFLAGRNIYSFGDFKQLLPPSGNNNYNSNQYLNMIYGNIINMTTNWRNNFTLEYYDKLINNKLDLQKEIKKHNHKSMIDAEIILCRTNKECDEYNDMYMDMKDLEFGQIGCKIICNSNDLREKNIYNSFTFEIKEVDKNTIILDDDIEITKKELHEYFKPGYAITFYKSQGQEYRSFYVPDSSIKGISSREAYTIISRLKEDKLKNDLQLKLY